MNEALTDDQWISVSPSMSVEDLVQLIFQKKHMGYPVMEGERLRGVVTLTDIERVPHIDRYVANVSDIMTRDIISVPSTARASDALKLISSKNIGRIMVVDNGSLVGILSRTDLMRILRLKSDEVSSLSS
jgi:CBS domain-containing protein